MKSPQQLYEQMERYLSDSMRKKERDAFEEKIRSNRRYSAELESFRILRSLIRVQESTASAPAAPRRKRSPKSTPPDSSPGASVSPTSSASADSTQGAGRFFMATAGIILLFALSVYLVNFLQPVPEKELFHAHFQVCPAPDPAIFPHSPAQWEAIRGHFARKDYAAAIPLLKEASSQPGLEGLKAHYYLGVSYLASNPPATGLAIEHLAKADIAQNPDQLDVEWYLGLAYLKAGQTRRASSLFERIYNQSKAEQKAQLGNLISDLQ